MRFLHPCAIVGTLALGGLGGAVALSGLGCGDNVAMYGPASGCSMNCGINSSGGVGGPKDGGSTTTGTGTGGAVASGELRGDIQRFADSTFQTIAQTAVTGAAGITVQPASGPQITAQYGGAAGPSFDIMSVPSGAAWVYVQDESNGANAIWPTITPLTVPQLGSVVFPVVDQGTFSNAFSNLPSVQSKGLSTQAAHVVLLLQYQGQPFSGLVVTSGSNGAVVVYDTGPGVYSDSALATGSGGTIVLLDAGGSGMQTITVSSAMLMKTYMLPVFTAAGAVTVTGFNLQ